MGALARVTAELRDVLGGRTRLTSAADLARVCLVVTHVPLDGDLRVALHRAAIAAAGGGWVVNGRVRPLPTNR
jgi:hypothetical protein